MTARDPTSEKDIAEMMERLAAADFGDGDEDSQRALEDHVAGNPDREALRASIAELWDDLGKLESPSLSAEEVVADEQDRQRQFLRDAWRRSGRLRAAAAILPIIAMVSALLIAFGALTTGDEAVRIAASPAERRVVALDDGSTVRLSADSIVDIRMKPQTRRLVLERGEALFEVAHDPERPFVVAAGNGEIQAIGTAFNVRMSGETVVVTVVEGTVSVRAGKEAGDGRDLVQFARAGQQVMFGMRKGVSAGSANASFIGPVENVDAGRYTSWAEGFLKFEGEPLGVVITEVNRHSARDIRLLDPGLADTRIYGVLHIGDVEGLRSIVKDIEGLDDDSIENKLVIAEPPR